ncbi:MAG TPA: hypothetical protein VLG44_01420 [Chlamydiales bacterium]|nr:hypothetical protein [Chlamydiales bacterium]
MSVKAEPIPSAFVWRRLHSLLGLWLVIYLMEHLITNSQAALWIGDDGQGFVRTVNAIQHLPYLKAIEVVLLGVPILLHGVWGVKRAFTAKSNAHSTNGSKPSLPYSRNRAFSWQRLTSWVLLVGIILHVVQMRFMDYPTKVRVLDQERFFVKLKYDEGLMTLAPRLGVKIYDKIPRILEGKNFSLKENEVAAETTTPGAAMLLSTRDTFKSPVMGVLYTIFVLAAAFHAFNGVWTSLITWGAILSFKSQNWMVKLCGAFMLVFIFLGLAAIWGSYWINLRT